MTAVPTDSMIHRRDRKHIKIAIRRIPRCWSKVGSEVFASDLAARKIRTPGIPLDFQTDFLPTDGARLPIDRSGTSVRRRF